MARNKIKLTASLKASGLIEVLISMVIIGIVFFMALGIYTNVLRLSLSVKKYHAQAALYQVLRHIGKSPGLSEENFIHGGFYIKQSIKIYKNQDFLKEIHLTARDRNELKLAEIKKVVYAYDPD